MNRDLFRTPMLVTARLLENHSIKRSWIWDPFAGAGHLGDVLRGHGHNVIETDIAPTSPRVQKGDFFEIDHPIANPVLVSHPPESKTLKAIRYASLKATSEAVLLVNTKKYGPFDITASIDHRSPLRFVKWVSFKHDIFLSDDKHDFDSVNGKTPEGPESLIWIILKRPEDVEKGGLETRSVDNSFDII